MLVDRKESRSVVWDASLWIGEKVTMLSSMLYQNKDLIQNSGPLQHTQQTLKKLLFSKIIADLLSWLGTYTIYNFISMFYSVLIFWPRMTRETFQVCVCMCFSEEATTLTVKFQRSSILHAEDSKRNPVSLYWHWVSHTCHKAHLWTPALIQHHS